MLVRSCCRFHTTVVAVLYGTHLLTLSPMLMSTQVAEFVGIIVGRFFWLVISVLSAIAFIALLLWKLDGLCVCRQRRLRRRLAAVRLLEA